MDFLL
jgi:phosphatidylinositol 3-kinase